jgi:hypothetical protein
MTYDTTPLPTGCKPQTTGLREFQSVADLPPAEIVAFFRAQPEAAQRVLGQSYDKRYSPSTFVEEADGGYRVGWYDSSRKHMQQFSDISEAVADYLLFSFGKGRLRC